MVRQRMSEGGVYRDIVLENAENIEHTVWSERERERDGGRRQGTGGSGRRGNDTTSSDDTGVSGKCFPVPGNTRPSSASEEEGLSPAGKVHGILRKGDEVTWYHRTRYHRRPWVGHPAPGCWVRQRAYLVKYVWLEHAEDD